MKEILLGLFVAWVAPLMASALQVTSYNVWADSRITITDDPKDDLPGGRNEWTIVLFRPTKTTSGAERGTPVMASFSNPPDFISLTRAISARPVALNPGSVAWANVRSTAETSPRHVGRKETEPETDASAAVPDQTSTGALTALCCAGLVLANAASRTRKGLPEI